MTCTQLEIQEPNFFIAITITNKKWLQVDIH